MGTELATARVKVKDGKALGKMGDTPAFIVKKNGRSKACYLNLVLGKYVGDRAAGAEAEMRERMRAILEWAGARPVVPVTTRDGKPINKLEVLRYVSGRSLYVGCVLDNPESIEARIAFPEERHVYDMRKGTYFGPGKSFDIVLPAQDALVLAALPYRVSAVNVKPARTTAGGVAKVEAAVHGQGETGPHCLRVEVVGPGGRQMPALAQNVLTPAGKAEIVIPFALNDPLGDYKVIVRDAASGVAGEATLTLQ